MAISDAKVLGVPASAQASGFTMNGMGNRAQPDVPNLPADEMKDVMDELSTKVLAPAHNKLLDELQILDTSNLVPHLKNLNDPDHPYHVATVIDANTQNGDIPTIGLLVNSFGGGDMSTIDYVTGDPDNVNAVDHALLADDADALDGHAASYFATAQDLSDLSQDVTDLGTPGVYKVGQSITLTDVCLPGVLLDNGTRVRFGITLDKPVEAGAEAQVSYSSTLGVYGVGGKLYGTGNLYPGLASVQPSITTSNHTISISAKHSSAIGSADNTPVVVVGTFTIVIASV